MSDAAGALPSPSASSAGLGMALPRAAALTEALLEPSGTRVSPGVLAGLRARLLRELEPIVEQLDPAVVLEIGSYELRLALERPERCGAPSSPFAPSARNCRRAVGLAAVEHGARGRAVVPQRAVQEVLASGLEDVALAAGSPGAPRPPWWAEWYAELVPGARAVVEAEAVTWATQLWSALDWQRFPKAPVVGGRDDRWELPSEARVVLRGRAEVRVWAERCQALLVVGAGFPGAHWRALLAYPALVAGLARGERSMPARVVGLWPASGMVRVCETDTETLQDTASSLVRALGVYARARARARRSP